LAHLLEQWDRNLPGQFIVLVVNVCHGKVALAFGL
jgi:hypothetical protein